MQNIPSEFIEATNFTAKTESAARPKKSDDALSNSLKKRDNANDEMIEANEAVLTLLKDAVGADQTQYGGINNKKLTAIHAEFDDLTQAGLQYLPNTNAIMQRFNRFKNSIKENEKLKALPVATLMQALEKAKTACVGYAQASNDYQADKINAKELILKSFNKGDITGTDGTKLNENATSFTELLSEGTTLSAGDLTLIVTSSGIRTKGYQAGQSIDAFAKLAIAWGRRHPNEQLVLGGPEQGLSDTLEIMAQAGNEDTDLIFTNGVKLSAQSLADMKHKFTQRRPGAVRFAQAALTHSPWYMKLTYFLLPIAGQALLIYQMYQPYWEQVSKIHAYTRMLNNIPNLHFSDKKLSRGQIYARTMINSYKELALEKNLDMRKAQSGDIPSSMSEDLDLELSLILKAQFQKADAKDMVEFFKGLQGKPLKMSVDRFKKQMPNDAMRQKFNDAIRRARTSAPPKKIAPGIPEEDDHRSAFSLSS